jgi:hypothetical protein
MHIINNTNISIKLMILNLFIGIFVIMNILVYISIYYWIRPIDTNISTYTNNLDNYI